MLNRFFVRLRSGRREPGTVVFMFAQCSDVTVVGRPVETRLLKR